MAEFQRVIKERNRMCKTNTCNNECPLFAVKGYDFCDEWPYKHPLEAEKIIMKWAKENPRKTNGMKFKEVFGLDYLDPLPGGCSAWLTAEYKEGVGQDETD